MFLNENWEISEILDDIILGRGVKRSIHDLEYDKSILTGLFIERLHLYKFRPITLRNIQIAEGWRAPAFFISGKTAIFGYVFWEIFSDKKKRKLFGSVVKNEKGDWKYILPAGSEQTIFVNMDLQEEFDLFHSY